MLFRYRVPKSRTLYKENQKFLNAGSTSMSLVQVGVFARLLPNRSPVAWGSQRIALGALIFHSNTFHFICWAPKSSAFSSEGSFKIFLGSSLDLFAY